VESDSLRFEPVGSGSSEHGTEVMRSEASVHRHQACAGCGQALPARAGYCESCGLDVSVAPIVERIVVEVSVDRSYFRTLDPGGLVFPSGREPQTLSFDGGSVCVGRRRDTGGTQPDLDLSGDLDDPGVSHRHAVISRADSGALHIIDAGSTNGTTINDSHTPIEVDVPVAVVDGDRIHVGAWTTITLRRRVDGTTG
jgi:ribosomal protein L37E